MGKQVLIQKLKAFILDPSASEGEQNNAIEILMKFRNSGIYVGDIPKAVRPTVRPRKVEDKYKIETPRNQIQTKVKVFSAIGKKYTNAYYCTKTPIQKPILKIPKLSVGDTISESIMASSKTIYRSTFYHYRIEYISFNKIDSDTFKIIEQGEYFESGRELIEESKYPIGNIENWSKDALDENSNIVTVTNIPI